MSPEEFKEAFKAIKKPKRPSNVSSKDKNKLETIVEETTDWNDPRFKDLAATLYQKNPGYMEDLIAYKFVKHFDEGSDAKPFWVQQVPIDAFRGALKKVVPGDMSDELTRETLTKSLRGKGSQSHTAALIYERDPDGMLDFALGKVREAKGKGDTDTAKLWGSAIPTDPEALTRLFKHVADANDEEMAKYFGENLTMIMRKPKLMEDGKLAPPEIDGARIYEIASENPKMFVDVILPGLKGKNQFIEIMGDAKLRAMLKETVPTEWATLVSKTPMLSLMEGVETQVKAKRLTAPKEIVAEMFDAIVNNRGIPLAYATNTIDNNRPILTGGTDKDRADRQITNDTMGDAAPDLPATQCHQLLHLTETMMEMCPGLTKKPKITQGTVSNILLTAPLGSIPGKGLLDKSFGGNVFDDSGKSTDQILFTGDGGINSHTWLVIDGVEYDPVLGTRGKEVADSIGERFDWKIVDRVAEGDKGHYIIKGDKRTPKPKANKMGFSSGYTITTTPDRYLTAEELEAAGLAVPSGLKV